MPPVSEVMVTVPEPRMKLAVYAVKGAAVRCINSGVCRVG